MATAVFGGGCFWCLEAVFNRLAGVTVAESGYMGGTLDHPTYEQVCSGTTGHVEVVRVTFEPKERSYADLLEVFFAVHDPTTLNRQGNDVGVQYRSVIFYDSEDQRREAAEAIAALSAKRVWPSPIVTAIEPVGKFFVAEPYHQGYFDSNPTQSYCRFVVDPKVKKFEKSFAGKMKHSH